MSGERYEKFHCYLINHVRGHGANTNHHNESHNYYQWMIKLEGMGNMIGMPQHGNVGGMPDLHPIMALYLSHVWNSSAQECSQSLMIRNVCGWNDPR